MRARYNIEIACSNAPTRVHDVSNNGPKCLPLAVALMCTIGGDKPHGRRINSAPPVPEIKSNRHGLGVEVWRAADARLALEPRKKKASRRTRGAVGAPPGERPPRVKVMTVPRCTEPRAQTAGVCRFAQRTTNLVENNVRWRIPSA